MTVKPWSAFCGIARIFINRLLIPYHHHAPESNSRIQPFQASQRL